MQLNVEEVLDLLGEERGGAAARVLATHPRTRDLIQEGGVYIYIDRTKRARGAAGANGTMGLHIMLMGLTKPLRRHYWPNYQWRRGATKSTPEMRVLQRSSLRLRGLQKKPEKQKEFVPAQETAQSHVRGSIVHRQLAQWVAMDKVHFRILNPDGKHPVLKALLQALDKRGWVPLAVEYKVACTEEKVRLATGIDLICVPGPVFIELKTTLDRDLFFQDDPRAPFTGLLFVLVQKWNQRWPKAKLLRSDCTRAKVQLAMGIWMALEGMGTSFQADFLAYVAVVSDTTRQVEWVEVSETFLLEVGRPLYLDLKKCIAAWRVEEQQSKAKEKTGTKRVRSEDEDPIVDDADEQRPQKRIRRE